MEEQNSPKKGKTKTGKVQSLTVHKTVVVEVEYNRKHWLYKKILRRTRRFLCHNETLDLNIGDTVVIKETRPISKNKYFHVIEKVS